MLKGPKRSVVVAVVVVVLGVEIWLKNVPNETNNIRKQKLIQSKQELLQNEQKMFANGNRCKAKLSLKVWYLYFDS